MTYTDLHARFLQVVTPGALELVDDLTTLGEEASRFLSAREQERSGYRASTRSKKNQIQNRAIILTTA